MSHFSTLVIGDKKEEQLAPYDEGLEVTPYKIYLDRKGFRMMSDWHLYGKNGDQEELGLLDKIERKLLLLILPFCSTKNFKLALADRMPEWSSSEGGVDGRGLYYFSTYNPRSKWDWNELGGRWEGFLILKDGGEANISKFGEIDWNKMIQEKKFPFAVVKDGEWFQKGRMGWWGIITNAKDDDVWEEEVARLLSDVSDETTMSIIDCHI